MEIEVTVGCDFEKCMAQRDEVTALDDSISRDEFLLAVKRLKHNKFPGVNGIPAEAFKALDSANINIVYGFVCDFWDGTADYNEWHTGVGTPIP